MDHAQSAGRLSAFGLDSRQINGKSILIIGSGDGSLCTAGLALGASRVVGIEPSPERVREARRAAAKAGSLVEFVEIDFERWKDGGAEFDIVICSGVLRHMLDPIHALRRMMELAHEQLLIDFSSPTLREMKKFRLSPGLLLGGGAGLIAPGRSRYTDNIHALAFALTPAAITTIVNRHSALFEPVSIHGAGGRGRRLMVAKRRRIDHLTVIAGPTSSGKSTLCDQLDAIRNELRLPPRDSAYVTASQARELPAGKHEHVVLHYDLLRPFLGGLHSYERDIATDLIAAAARVTFVTIVADPERLRNQLLGSEIASGPKKASPRHLQLLELYADPAFLPAWYRAWLNFCRKFSGKSAGHFIVENCGVFIVKGPIGDDADSLFLNKPGHSAGTRAV